MRVFLTLLGLFYCANVCAIDMKVDRISVNIPTGGAVTWADVTFQQTFGAVPVVFVTPTNTNSDPVTVRIRNITTTGFEVGLTEPPGEDGQTTSMLVDYFAAEAGTYVFAGGVRMVVGTTSTSTFQGRNNSGTGWDTVPFGFTFSSAPAVVAQIQSINSQPSIVASDIGNPFFDVAIRNVSTSDMELALERAETSNGTVVAETVGFVAMESGDQFTESGADVQALLTPDNIQGWDNGCFSNNVSSSFTSTPLIVASQNSRDGSDGGWVRRCTVTDTAVGFAIDEDRSSDSERSHTTEEAGVLAISNTFAGTRNGMDLEAGQVTIDATSGVIPWTSVSFPTEFNSMPRIFALPTDQGANPASIRVRNVTTNGFDIAAIQPDGNSGAHPQMDIDYLAIVDGEHTLPGNYVFEVGTVSTDLVQASGSGSTGVETVIFNTPFSSAPAFLAQIQTIANEPALDPSLPSSPWLVTAVTDITANDVDFALERAEVTSGSISLPETIAYFAVADGTNGQLEATDTSTIDFEMFVTPTNIEGWDDGCFDNSFTDTYSTPHALATQLTRNGNNGGWLRRCDLQTNSIGLAVDEDTFSDSERAHIDEQAGVFVFGDAFEALFNQIDHYGIFHSGTGVTCEAENVIVAALDAGDLPAAEVATRTFRITATSTTVGWSAADSSWSLVSGSGSFATPSAGVAEYTFATAESSVELAFANISEADIDFDVLDLADSSITDIEGSAQDPILSFTNTGLRFYDDANSDGDSDGTPIQSILISGQTSNDLILRAVETDTETGACIARVTGSQSVSMAYECVNPTSCIRNDDASVSSTAIADNDLSAVSDFNSVSLTFDSDGEAVFNLQYFDVGAIRLYAELGLSASGSDPAINLSGSSAITTAKPADLVITTIESLSSAANPGTTNSGSGFVTADSAFRVVVESRNSLGNLTPNFGNETSSEDITLSVASLVFPAAGNNPALVSADSFSATSTAGEFENTSVRWPEAGTITINASISDGDYLLTGDVTGTASGNVGRFYPDHFSLISGSITSECVSGNFSYMSDQSFNHTPLDTVFTIEAQTAAGSRLQNYDNASLAFPTETFSIVAENNNDGTNLSGRAQLSSAAQWINGRLEESGAENLGFRRNVSGLNETPDGPFSGLEFGLMVTGSGADSVDFLSSSLDINPTTATDCTLDTSCNGIGIGSAQQLSFARIFGENSFGPETSSLAVPLEIQTWNGSEFAINSADNCTLIPAADTSFDGDAIDVDGERTVAIGSGNTTGTFAALNPGVSFSFANGDASLNFSAPGTGNTGSFLVEIDLSNLPWLRHDWNSDGDFANDTSLPGVLVNFGSYRGHDRVIFWQEQLD